MRLKLNETYQAPIASLWQGRNDSLPGEHFFQIIKCHDLRHNELSNNTCPTTMVLIGFACDAGIKRNLGRTGASLGPDLLRVKLAPLAIHTQLTLLDLGNIACVDDKLEAAQQDLANLINYAQQCGHKTLVIGGGHEMAWGHYQGLAPMVENGKFGIINFDAHFDLRACPRVDYGTSGTPFLQIATARSARQLAFNYCCIGIQPNSNTQTLFNTAQLYQVDYLTASQMNQQPLQQQLSFIADFLQQQDMIYLTICLDVFGHSFAPGVSAPQPLGITPWQAIPLLHAIINSGKVISIDIAEFSPPYDESDKTAKLAAHLVAEIFGQIQTATDGHK